MRDYDGGVSFVRAEDIGLAFEALRRGQRLEQLRGFGCFLMFNTDIFVQNISMFSGSTSIMAWFIVRGSMLGKTCMHTAPDGTRVILALSSMFGLVDALFYELSFRVIEGVPKYRILFYWL